MRIFTFVYLYSVIYDVKDFKYSIQNILCYGWAPPLWDTLNKFQYGQIAVMYIITFLNMDAR